MCHVNSGSRLCRVSCVGTIITTTKASEVRSSCNVRVEVTFRELHESRMLAVAPSRL